MSWDGMYSTFDADGSNWQAGLNEWHMSDDTLDIVRSTRSEAHSFVDFTFSDTERGDLEAVELKSCAVEYIEKLEAEGKLEYYEKYDIV